MVLNSFSAGVGLRKPPVGIGFSEGSSLTVSSQQFGASRHNAELESTAISGRGQVTLMLVSKDGQCPSTQICAVREVCLSASREGRSSSESNATAGAEKR